MLVVLLSGFVLALLAPWIHRLARGATGWLLALLPLGWTAYWVRLTGPIMAGDVLTVSYPWVPSVGLNASLYVDGLSLLFALLISGMGVLVLIYAGGYLAGQALLGRFYAYLLLFMTAMLGLVLAGNLLLFFVFWELTSFSSYLLIGFEHERDSAQEAARQALLVTGGGGLSLLAGLVLLAQAGGSVELGSLLTQDAMLRTHALAAPCLVLLLIGVATKSAQVPFHFWLPNAMAAPTPVSAYLHSATMVKAGVYLLARLSPLFGGTAVWHLLVPALGAGTMLVGAVLALMQSDMKRILAYATVSALGTLVFLLGLDTTLSTQAAMVFLLVHALYKGALFMVAGAVDHETGTRDIRQLGGLYRVMPWTTAAAVLAALSMAGLPPMLGFISKELLYEAKLHAPYLAPLVTGAGVLANGLAVAVAALLTLRPFFGPLAPTPKTAHAAPLSLWLGPLCLAGLGLLTGLLPELVALPLITPAVTAIRATPTVVTLELWHGLNPVFALSVLTVLGGLGVYAGRHAVWRAAQRYRGLARLGPERWYGLSLEAMQACARAQTRWLQSGSLRTYLAITLLTMVVLVGAVVWQEEGSYWLTRWQEVRFYEWGAVALIGLGTLTAIMTGSRLAAVAALGVVGYSIALLYVYFGAPDLALTQFAIETLTVVLFVLVLARLPRLARLSSAATRLRDALLALAAGGVMTTLVLVVTAAPLQSRLAPYFQAHSLEQAHGRNIVNVILVDFRGLDTLGEITVIAVAGLGVYALLTLRPGKDKSL